MGIFNLFKKKQEPPQRKQAQYKNFPFEKCKQNPFYSLAVENDEYDFSKREIYDNSLEDEKIYKKCFPDLHPSLADNGNGYDVLINDIVLGTISSDVADALDDFLDAHPNNELLLDVIGGPYKIYDSAEEEIKTGTDKYSAKLCVKYYA